MQSMQTHETAGPPAREHGRHRHDDHRGRMTAMTIDTIKQTDLTVSERQVLDDDRERWRRMGSGAHLDDWLAYGPGLLPGWRPEPDCQRASGPR